MKRQTLSTLMGTVASIAVAVSLGGCNTFSRLSEVGSGPQISNIENPTQRQGYQPISMPMPQPLPPPQNANSLWRTGSRAFFKDQRAKDVGDILSVVVSVNDTATLTTSLSRSRAEADSANITSLMGFQSSLASILPSAVNPASMLNVGSTATSTNAGSTGRTETLTTTLAAVITQVLPNGNLVISGRQEMRVNFEMRELTIQGIIRPEDLSTSNSVNYQKIAEARIYYGGRGVASELAQPRYGHEVLDILFPF
jgi:flagellar L-ring protein precursor FlgH